jgi:RimJ/RimL family protein N-acetyltransferase
MTGAPRLVLRRARPDDASRLLAWRNDAATRRWFLDASRVQPDAHRAWFARRLEDGRSRIYIAETAGVAVGQLRLDRRGPRAAEVSFSVDRRHRGRGYGTLLLKRAPAAARRDLGVGRLVAHVKPDNIASAVAFLKAGFQFTGLAPRGGQPTKVFESNSA